MLFNKILIFNPPYKITFFVLSLSKVIEDQNVNFLLLIDKIDFQFHHDFMMEHRCLIKISFSKLIIKHILIAQSNTEQLLNNM